MVPIIEYYINHICDYHYVYHFAQKSELENMKFFFYTYSTCVVRNNTRYRKKVTERV